MGREISRDFAGRKLDVVTILEDSYVFSADLVRHIQCPLVCHFVRTDSHEIKLGSHERKEIFFSHEPDLKGRDVLLVDAVLDTGITLDFLLRRLWESRPRSLRLAVLLDRPHARRLALKPDYVGFEASPNYLVGYGLASRDGFHRNLAFVGALDGRPHRARLVRRAPARKRKKGSRVGK
jgi:hypoxanthine phosphoribosyltransferase